MGEAGGAERKTAVLGVGVGDEGDKASGAALADPGAERRSL